jgi:hypothetical protein
MFFAMPLRESFPHRSAIATWSASPRSATESTEDEAHNGEEDDQEEEKAEREEEEWRSVPTIAFDRHRFGGAVGTGNGLDFLVIVPIPVGPNIGCCEQRANSNEDCRDDCEWYPCPAHVETPLPESVWYRAPLHRSYK